MEFNTCPDMPTNTNSENPREDRLQWQKDDFIDKRTLEIMAGILQQVAEKQNDWEVVRKWARQMVEEIQAQTAHAIIMANSGAAAKTAMQTKMRGRAWS